jgi:hypothetical protein
MHRYHNLIGDEPMVCMELHKKHGKEGTLYRYVGIYI